MQCTRSVAADQYSDALIAANMMTLLCERKQGVSQAELAYRLGGGTNRGWIERH